MLATSHIIQEGYMTNDRTSKLLWASVLIFGLCAAPALFSQTEDYKALLGSWDVELVEPGITMELVFKMDGEELTGEMIFDMGGAELEDITFEGGELTFNASVDAGGQMIEVSASALIQEDEMEGTMMTDMGEVTFSGTKRKD
jgi:hypothetical protein